jgi:hypothetical protein
MICVGPGSEKGFGPPCEECIYDTEREYQLKQAKAVGVELLPEEAERIRKKFGIG